MFKHVTSTSSESRPPLPQTQSSRMKLELGVTSEEPEVDFEERELGPLNWVSRVRRWWRLNVGGFLWVVVGAYLLWRLLNVMAGLYSSSEVVTDKPVWPDTRNIFVFGDSLSQTGYNPFGEHPSISNPLGNPPYPGWTTSAGPNWVDYLITEHNHSTVMAHVYAISGYTVTYLRDDLNLRFFPHAAKKPSYVPWTGKDTIFFTWIGVNDILYSMNIQFQLSLSFQLQEKLYRLGARNFVFFTVPPFDRTPWGRQQDPFHNRINEWNTQLTKLTNAFRSKHRDARVGVFSTGPSWEKMLENPVQFGFRDDHSACASRECMWNIDEDPPIHPTFGMHNVMAGDLSRFLETY